MSNTYHVIRVLGGLWGLLWGLFFNFLVVWRVMVSNRKPNGRGEGSPSASITIPGTLAIGSNLGPIAALPATCTPSSVSVALKTAPLGSSLVVVVYVNGVIWQTVTVAASATTGSTANTTQITAGQLIRVDITAVGSTYPGGDITVFINP